MLRAVVRTTTGSSMDTNDASFWPTLTPEIDKKVQLHSIHEKVDSLSTNLIYNILAVLY